MFWNTYLLRKGVYLFFFLILYNVLVLQSSVYLDLSLFRLVLFYQWTEGAGV